MKKLINLLAVVAIVTVGFVSCDKKSDSNVDVENVDVQQETQDVPVEVTEVDGDTITSEVDTVEVQQTTVTEE